MCVFVYFGFVDFFYDFAAHAKIWLNGQIKTENKIEKREDETNECRKTRKMNESNTYYSLHSPITIINVSGWS